MEVIILAYVVWTGILLVWTKANMSDTKQARHLIEQARRTAKDNLKLFSTRNELRNVSFIFDDGNVKTYTARGYRHDKGFFSVFDKDGNLVVKISDKEVKEVRLTRSTEYTYIEPNTMLSDFYDKGSVMSEQFTELK